jgi:putative methyltransferase (TIGR04325 family)
MEVTGMGNDSHWITLAKIALCRTQIGSLLRKVPFVESQYAAYTYKRRDHGDLFVGKFNSYEEASAAIPETNEKGWDNARSSRLWINHPDFMQPTTYTMFFWLAHLLLDLEQRGKARILDYGGSIGLSYYSYTKRASLRPETEWIVAEVQSLVDSGKALAEKRGVSWQLSFMNSGSILPAVDILYSGGALQYDPQGIPGILERSTRVAPHILLNKIPLTDGASLWTTQNISTAIAPYRIFNRREFLDYFYSWGYKEIDEWKVFDASVDIPFYPENCVPQLAGMYLSNES